MLYIFIDKNRIKLLLLKKSMLGQYDTVFFEKEYEADLLTDGKPVNIDHVASAIKEALQSVNEPKLVEKEIILILPQSSFHYLRFDVPADVASGALASFVKDKAKANLHVNLDDCLSEYFAVDRDKEKQINFYAIPTDTISKFREALTLIDLKLSLILPETLAYYKLIEKTLRKEKKEFIWYVVYEKNYVLGYLYDTFGLASEEKWTVPLAEGADIEAILREKAQSYEAAGMKLNRLILSGSSSETVRQDTFTKSIGVWTNPIKRIISNFYQEYLKMLVSEEAKPFPVLSYDVSLGSFIFTHENKNFSFLKPTTRFMKAPSFKLPATSIRKKELLIFIGSFAISFLFFILISKSKLSLPNISLPMAKATPTASPIKVPPSPSPVPSFKKEDLKLKVLNGSGTAGKATEVKDILVESGYGEILTGNADNFDFAKTEIQVKADKKAAGSTLTADLKTHVTSPTITTLDDSEAADVVIIIGTDFK